MPSGNITENGTLFTDFIPTWDGGDWNAQINLTGTWGGGTVQLYIFADGGDGSLGPASDDWLTVVGGTWTADDSDIINASGKRRYKAILTGATSPDLDWNIV